MQYIIHKLLYMKNQLDTYKIPISFLEKKIF